MSSPQELDATWKMLDEMAKNDPEAYEQFIKKATGGKARGPMTVMPTPGIVVKAYAVNKTTKQGSKLFVNVCSHKGVQLPLDAKGQKLGDEAPGFAARQIPLLVGEARRMEDNSGKECFAVDVLYNPWVLTRVTRPTEEQFKTHVVNLALRWISDDLDKEVRPGWKAIKSEYKGGTGPHGITPVPFVVKNVEEDGQEAGGQGEGGEAKKADGPTSKAGFGQTMSSPSSLLASMRAAEQDQGGEADGGVGFGALNFSRQQKGGKTGGAAQETSKPLIAELDADGKVKAKKKTTTTAGKKKKKKKGGVVKKGFLRNTKGKLYPKGSSEGEPKSPYPPGFQTVDTRGMSKSEMQKVMEKHAGPGGNRRELTEEEKKKRAEAARKKHEEKMAAQPKSALQQMAEDMQSSMPEPKSRLDEMMEEADPELGSTTRADAGASGFMSDFSKAMSVLGTGSMAQAVAPPSTTTTNKTTKPTPVTTTSSSSSSSAAAPPPPPDSQEEEPEHTVKLDHNKNRVVVVVTLPKLDGLAGLDLEVDGDQSQVRLRAPGKYRLHLELRLPNGKRIDGDSARAKFSKKKRQLKLSIEMAERPTSES